MNPEPTDLSQPVSLSMVPPPCSEAGSYGAREMSSCCTFTGTTGWRFSQLVALIKTTSLFAADVKIRKEACKVDGKSLVDLLTLGVKYGDTLTIHAIGHDAPAALLAVAALPFFSPTA